MTCLKSLSITAICSALTLSACEIVSDGLELSPVAKDVVIEWHAIDAHSGEMSALLAGGQLYRGPYSTPHQGEILANLISEDGERLRCRFRLEHPSIGMAGGGSGDCEATGGERTAARFLPRR